MARNTRTYSDLDFNFMAHPVSGDVTVKYDVDAVNQSLKSLIMTKNFERPFRSSIGSQVNALLFEPSSPITSAMIERTIRDVIDSYEPRVDLLDVKVTYSPNNNSVYVTIYFKLKNTESPLSFNLILERTR
jgi:phage baseplate assembly protein W